MGSLHRSHTRIHASKSFTSVQNRKQNSCISLILEFKSLLPSNILFRSIDGNNEIHD